MDLISFCTLPTTLLRPTLLPSRSLVGICSLATSIFYHFGCTGSTLGVIRHQRRFALFDSDDDHLVVSDSNGLGADQSAHADTTPHVPMDAPASPANAYGATAPRPPMSTPVYGPRSPRSDSTFLSLSPSPAAQCCSARPNTARPCNDVHSSS